MNHMNAKTYLESHRDDRIPSFALAPYSAEYITEWFQTRVIVAILDPKTIVIIAGPYEQLTPVNCSDRSGHSPILLGMILIGAAVGVLSYTASEVASYGLAGEWSWSWGGYLLTPSSAVPLAVRLWHQGLEPLLWVLVLGLFRPPRE